MPEIISRNNDTQAPKNAPSTQPDEGPKVTQAAVKNHIYSKNILTEEAFHTPKIPVSGDKKIMERELEKIYEELTAKGLSGEHKHFLTQELPDSAVQSEALLRSRAKYLIRLNRDLRFYKMPEKAETIENQYYTDSIKDNIFWEIAYKWYSVLAIKFNNEHTYEDRIKLGDEREKELQTVANKSGLSGANYYLWAANIAVNHEQNLEKFEAALKKAAEAQSRCLDREYEGPELAMLAANAKKIFESIIPSIQEVMQKS